MTCTNSSGEETADAWYFIDYKPSPHRIFLSSVIPPRQIAVIQDPTHEEIAAELIRDRSDIQFYTGDPARVRIVPLQAPVPPPASMQRWTFSHFLGREVMVEGEDCTIAALWEPTAEEIETCRKAELGEKNQYTGAVERLVVVLKKGAVQ